VNALTVVYPYAFDVSHRLFLAPLLDRCCHDTGPPVEFMQPAHVRHLALARLTEFLQSRGCTGGALQIDFMLQLHLALDTVIRSGTDSDAFWLRSLQLWQPAGC
jgi:hypothetical protein